MKAISAIRQSYEWRKRWGYFNHQTSEPTEALRLFYGPGETDDPELKKIAVDIFQAHASLLFLAHHPPGLFQ